MSGPFGGPRRCFNSPAVHSPCPRPQGCPVSGAPGTAPSRATAVVPQGPRPAPGHGGRTRWPVPLFGLFAWIAPALATAEPAVPSALVPVTVTARRLPARIDDTIAETSLLERADITRESGRTLSSILALQPGLQTSANGGFGQYSSVLMRGLEARHTLLLVDGMRLGSATVGVPSLDNLPLAAIERIEIVRGPLSSLYGSDAVGGVVQVFTRRGQEGFWPNAAVSVGARGYGQISGGLAFGQGALDGAIQLSRMRQNGISATNSRALWDVYDPDADGFAQNGGSLRLGWNVAQDWRIEGSLLSANGISHYDDGLGADSRARLRNSVQQLSARGKLTADWGTRIALARSTDSYDTLVSASPYTELGATRTEQRQLSWENTLATPWGTGLALIERLDQNVERPGEAYTVSARTIDAVGLSLAGEAAQHSWQGGVRRDHNSQFGNQTTGSLGYGFALTPAWRVGAQYGTSFVAPSFNQLYYPGYGNPNLLPEEGRHAELSLRWAQGSHALRGAWVDHRIRGYIASGPQPVNVPRTQIDGVVLSYEGHRAGLQWGASYDHLDPRNTTAGPDAGKLLPRRAQQALRTQARYSHGPYGLGTTVAAFSARYDDAENTRRLPGFVTMDWHADWTLDREWTVSLQLLNATDRSYETVWGYNQPGRQAFLTLGWAKR